MSSRDVRSEAGSSTVLVVGLVAVLLTVTVAALTVLGALRAAHVARSASDLAALAGAAAYQQAPDRSAACAEARRIARSHDAQLVTCEVGAGGAVTVVTSVPITHRIAGVGADRAEGRARAGPAPGAQP